MTIRSSKTDAGTVAASNPEELKLLRETIERLTGAPIPESWGNDAKRLAFIARGLETLFPR